MEPGEGARFTGDSSRRSFFSSWAACRTRQPKRHHSILLPTSPDDDKSISDPSLRYQWRCLSLSERPRQCNNTGTWRASAPAMRPETCSWGPGSMFCHASGWSPASPPTKCAIMGRPSATLWAACNLFAQSGRAKGQAGEQRTTSSVYA